MNDASRARARVHAHFMRMQCATGTSIYMTNHKDSERYVPIWDQRGGGHIRRARRPDATNYTPNRKYYSRLRVRIRTRIHVYT